MDRTISIIKNILSQTQIIDNPLPPDFKITKFRDAAVLIPLYFCKGQWYIIFTERTDRVPTHKGQVSFPGGKKDPTDISLEYTAKREAHEEIGIHPDEVTILGRTSSYSTPSGFKIFPFVGIINHKCNIEHYIVNISEDEVEQVIIVPLNHLLDETNMEIKPHTRNGIEYLLPYFYYEEHVIWGATGLILNDFITMIKDYL